jgi:hypothetical protein
MLVILVLTLWSMFRNLGDFISDGEVLLVILSALILLLTAWLTGSSFVALVKKGSGSGTNV